MRCKRSNYSLLFVLFAFLIIVIFIWCFKNKPLLCSVEVARCSYIIVSWHMESKVTGQDCGASATCRERWETRVEEEAAVKHQKDPMKTFKNPIEFKNKDVIQEKACCNWNSLIKTNDLLNPKTCDHREAHRRNERGHSAECCN